MVVNNFDFVGIAISPFKADSPLIVYADAPLTCSISPKPLQAIARRFIQQFNAFHVPNLAQLPECNSLNRSELAAVNTVEDSLRLFIRKRLNHWL
jgi:hypothetical protein